MVGGPWVTVAEDYFDGLADVDLHRRGRGDLAAVPARVAARHDQARYEQPEATDMTRVPAPRFDLLKMRQYLFGSLQFSRGCPFQCEFCDIIVTFGRRPRLKTPAQVIAELDSCSSGGWRSSSSSTTT